MDHFTRIKTSLLVTLVLLFTAVTGQGPSSFTARVGGEVTLPCGNVMKDQQNCDRTSWLFSRNTGRTAVELITHGTISTTQISKDHSDRLRVTADCSLVVTNITREDVGRYACRQLNESGKQHGDDALVYLSVINIERQEPIIYCSALTYGECGHTVQWIYMGSMNNTETSQHACSATVTFTTPHLYQNSDELLYCNVTDNKSGQTLLLNVPQKTGSTSPGGDKMDDTPTKADWKTFIIVSAVLAALLIIFLIVVAFIRRKKTKGNKSQMSENNGQNLNPAVTQPDPETNQDRADPEDGVAYASINYNKKSNSKTQKADGDDEGSVTYSTVKMSSPASEASADPSSLYATVNKPNNKEDTG
uniref:uncharacterized protein n=1 Tax=Semicossyphus pulcher TaxID=241346 RepID=UPI0037E790A6